MGYEPSSGCAKNGVSHAYVRIWAGVRPWLPLMEWRLVAAKREIASSVLRGTALPMDVSRVARCLYARGGDVPPETRFAKGPHGAVGYQVFGNGPDLVFVSQWGTNIDTFWDEPSAARYLDRLATFSRVILYDKRGTGVSDPIDFIRLPTMEDWTEDITLVLDEVGTDDVILVGDAEGGLMTIAYAAAYPDRVSSLILINAHARALRADDYHEGMPPHIAEYSR